MFAHHVFFRYVLISTLCSIRFELSQEQWDIYKLDPAYHCVIRDASQIPAIVRCAAAHTPSTHPPRPSSPISGLGHKRRVPSPGVQTEEDDEGATSTAPTSPIPRKKKRAPIPTSASVRVETETETENENENESDESEVEGMIVDDDDGQSRGHLPQSQSQSQSQSRGRARSVKEKNRRARQQKTARRTEWLSNQNPNEYSMFDNTASPSIGKRKSTCRLNLSAKNLTFCIATVLSTGSDSITPLTKNEASAHHNDSENSEFTRNKRTKTSYWVPTSSTGNTATANKRARTVSPSSAKRSLWAYKQARERQKAEMRRLQQEEKIRAREEEVLEELLRGAAGSAGSAGNGFGYGADAAGQSTFNFFFSFRFAVYYYFWLCSIFSQNANVYF